MDMYLPTLPAMADFFHTSSSMVQLGLTTSMIGLAAGQLIFGPLSDKYGRRPPLLLAMILFLLATVGCIFSHTISQFVTSRFLQGIAGAGGVVISRSIATDEYSGQQLAGMLAVIGGINGIATVIAPIGGGILAQITSWQGIFICLFFMGVVLLSGSLHLNESLPAKHRQTVSWQDLYHSFGEVLHNRRYVGYVLQYGFTMGILFVNISSAPFIMQQHYGLSPLSFSLCFGINAIAMVISSAISIKLPTMERALYIGSRGMLSVSALLMVFLSLRCDFWIYELLIFALLSMIGMTFTASNTLAMECERRNAGIASALLGATGFAFGGIVSPLVSLGDMMTSTGILFLAGSTCAYACTRYVLSQSVQPSGVLYH
jgi:drug resistance transporter, bcr/cflA subfamily